MTTKPHNGGAIFLTLMAATLTFSFGCPDIGPDGAGGQDAVSGSASGAGKTFYVSTGGDDGADGLSTATAFKTIVHAVQSVGPGGTVAIGPGTYSESIMLEPFGGAAATITIRGENGTPILDGQRAKPYSFWCGECTNVVFDGLEITNYSDAGILVTGSQDVTMRNLAVHDNGFAAKTDWAEGYGIHADDSLHVTIEDNVVYENGPSPQILGKWLGTGINTFNLTDSFIRNNVSRDNTGGGLLVEDSTNVLVEGNEFTGNELDATIEDWWDGGIWLDGGKDVTIRNNTIRGNHGPGIIVSDEDNQLPTGYVVENNTISGNLYGFYIWNFGTTSLPSENILRLSGNTLSGNTEGDFWFQAFPCPPDDPCE